MPRSAHEILKNLVETFPEFNDPDAQVSGSELIAHIAGEWDDILAAVGLNNKRSAGPDNGFVYATSIKYSDGLMNRFSGGPYPSVKDFTPQPDEIVFLVSPAGEAKIAVDVMLAHAQSMNKEVFLSLNDALEQAYLARAKGEDAVMGFDERVKALETVLEASPWTMHPDYGCVREDLIEGLDAQSGSMKP